VTSASGTRVRISVRQGATRRCLLGSMPRTVANEAPSPRYSLG
jgi:hypothetical protein